MKRHPVEEALNRFGLVLMEWWPWAWLLLATGLTAFAVSWLVHPVDGTEQLYLANLPFGSGCDYRREYGHGCMNCGMTRSWVYGARGQLATAARYNPAGLGLFAALVSAGVLSGLRLVLRRRVLRVPWAVSLGLAAAWVVVWLGVYALRTQGYLPLPPDP